MEIAESLDQMLADEAVNAALEAFDVDAIDLAPLDDIPNEVIEEFL